LLASGTYRPAAVTMSITITSPGAIVWRHLSYSDWLCPGMSNPAQTRAWKSVLCRSENWSCSVPIPLPYGCTNGVPASKRAFAGSV
jgi:hypothetical protein